MSPRRVRYRVPFSNERFQIRPGAEQKNVAGLNSSLAAARVTLHDFDGSAPIEAALAHFPQLSIVAMSTPRVTATWHRDGGSADVRSSCPRAAAPSTSRAPTAWCCAGNRLRSCCPARCR